MLVTSSRKRLVSVAMMRTDPIAMMRKLKTPEGLLSYDYEDDGKVLRKVLSRFMVSINSDGATKKVLISFVHSEAWSLTSHSFKFIVGSRLIT